MRRLLLLVIVALAVAAPAQAGRSPIHPVAHPSCHCKARWNHKPYVFWSTAVVTENGHSRVVRIRCRTNPRNGNTWCEVKVPA